MIPIRNDKLIIENVDDDFSVVVNPMIAKGFKLINKKQRAVLDSIDGSKTVEQVALENNISPELAYQVIDLFKSKDIVSYSEQFQVKAGKPSTRYLGLWIHTTNACTLACSYCYIKTKTLDEHFSKEAQVALYGKIIETVRYKNVTNVHLRVAGGEPLLRFLEWQTFLSDLHNELKNLNCRLTVSFLSNLTVLSDNFIAYLKSNKFISIGVSLDGFGDYHDNERSFINGKGSFNKTYSNINRLIENGIHPSIMTTVSQTSMEGLPLLTDYVIEKNLSFRFSMVQGQGIDRQRLSSILNLCYEKFEKAIDSGYEFTQLHHVCDLRFFNISYQTCNNGVSGTNVYIDGTTAFCHKHFGTDQITGSIFENDNLFDIIARGNHHNSPLSKECESCKYRYICSGGCPLERVNAKSLDCEIFQEFIPKIYRLMGKEKIAKIKNGLTQGFQDAKGSFGKNDDQLITQPSNGIDAARS